MRKAINAAFGGDLIRGSRRSACRPPRALRFRYPSARGIASSKRRGPTWAWGPTNTLTSECSWPQFGNEKGLTGPTQHVAGSHVVATPQRIRSSRPLAIDFMAHPTRFDRVTFAFGGQRFHAANRGMTFSTNPKKSGMARGAAGRAVDQIRDRFGWDAGAVWLVEGSTSRSTRRSRLLVRPRRSFTSRRTNPMS